ncbi:MAG: alpha/beta hydrolase fold domain-containing protein [Bacteroidales bacterium]|jgi:acetyl esterase/lipase|nr:alpha/beta hydrolase fold domain-containing protein [Bacteroidales bacterium]
MVIRFKYCCILFLSAFISLYTYGQTAKGQKRFTIMGLGDSLTAGGDYFHSYLFPLWERLFIAGYSFDFIGPRSGKCRIGSLNHSGFSGKNAEYLDAHIDSIYHKYPADFVLLHAGHNHFDTEKPVTGIISAYQSIIRKIKSINPDVYILVAEVVTSGKLPKYSYIPGLNLEIERMVKEMNDDHVILVDHATGFDWKQHTINDMVHPNRQGAEKMADQWFEAMKNILAPSGQAFHPRMVTYKTLDTGEELKLHIFMPDHLRKKQKRPVIVFFFGGGWALGTPLQFYRECAYYTSKGMVAVSAEYRISYMHKSSPFESFEDAKDVIEWLRTNASEYHIDPGKIAAAGASAGGHLAAALGTIQDTGRKSKVSYRPDLLLLYYPVVDNGENGYGSQAMKERFKEISPLHNISSNTPPTLFILGTKDQLIPVKTAQEFERRLQSQNVECELHLLKGAGHPIFQYRKELTNDFYTIRRITDNFLSRHGYMKKQK